MSDTPRTDLECFEIVCSVTFEPFKSQSPDGEYVSASYARQLERELAAAQNALKTIIMACRVGMPEYDINDIVDIARSAIGGDK